MGPFCYSPSLFLYFFTLFLLHPIACTVYSYSFSWGTDAGAATEDEAALPAAIPIPTTSPPPLAIPAVYEGKVCACTLMAELMAKLNLLADKQISAINTKSAKVTINAAALMNMKVEAQGTTIVVKGELEADPTLFDQLDPELRLKLNVNIQKILASIRNSDVIGMGSLMVSGSISSLTELKVQMQKKASGITTLASSLFTKFKLTVAEEKKKLKPGAISFCDESKSLLGDGASAIVKLVGENLVQQPGLGDQLVNTFLSVFFSLDISISSGAVSPAPPSSSPTPPISPPSSTTTSEPPLLLGFGFPPLGAPLPPLPTLPPIIIPGLVPSTSTPLPPIGGGGELQLNVNFSLSLSLIMNDVLAKVQANKDTPALLIDPLELNANAQLKLTAQKIKDQMPPTALELLSMVKPIDVEGLKMIANLCIDAKLDIDMVSPPPPPAPPLLADALPPLPPVPSSIPSTPSTPSTSPSTPPSSTPSPDLSGQLSIDIVAMFNEKCPGINGAMAAGLAKIDAYMKQFGNGATLKLGKMIASVKMSLMAKLQPMVDGDQPAFKELLNAIKAKYPEADPFINGKIDIKAAFSAILIGNMQMLSNPKKKQELLANLKVDDPSLNQLAANLNGQLSVNAKTVLALMKPDDVDGLKLVLNLSAQGQLNSVRDLIKAMQEKCPGLLEAMRILAKNLLVLGESVYDKLSPEAKELIKKLLKALKDFLKNDLKSALMQLDKDVPGLLAKLMDDLMISCPSLKPLIIGIKFSLNISVNIQINGSPPQVMVSPAPPPLPIPAPAPPAPAPVPPAPAPAPPAPAPTTPPCPAGGQWGEWAETGTCTKQCGKCGSKKKERKCLSAPACPCTGPSTQDVPCPDQPCIFPEKSCCDGQSAKAINGKVRCP